MLFRRGSCSSLIFRDLSLEVGLDTIGDVVDVLSSGPFFISLVANCSNRDLSELTEERVVSSGRDSLVSILIMPRGNEDEEGK